MLNHAQKLIGLSEVHLAMCMESERSPVSFDIPLAQVENMYEEIARTHARTYEKTLC